MLTPPSLSSLQRALLWGLLFVLLALLNPHPALAAGTDLFATGKANISATLFGNTVKYIMYASAGVVGLIVGIFQKNWPLGIATFFITMIAWNVIESLLP